jgi:hypothetical protein
MPTDDPKVLSRKARALNPSDRIALVEDVLDSLDKIDPTVLAVAHLHRIHRKPDYWRDRLRQT